MLRVGSWELVVPIVKSLVTAVNLPSVVQTFSIVYSKSPKETVGGDDP